MNANYNFRILCSSPLYILNTQRSQKLIYKLIYLYLFTDYFMKISLQSSEQIWDQKLSPCSDDLKTCI